MFIRDAANGIAAGMSGSPILNDDGAAIGVVSTAGGRPGELLTEGGPQASLCHALPGWLLRQLDNRD